MKIEKINNNQIRCTLTKSDLADRELKISELAYGSEKAKSLFRDMMTQASYECGFEADDIPLMIEAVPINADCIVLTVTKVEDPEELDTRFSTFAPSVHESPLPDYDDDEPFTPVASQPVSVSSAGSEIYVFPSLHHIIRLAHVVSELPIGQNCLYKDSKNNRYYLYVACKDMSAKDINRLCNIISEYGSTSKGAHYTEAYLAEHFELICKNHALQSLSVV